MNYLMSVIKLQKLIAFYHSNLEVGEYCIMPLNYYFVFVRNLWFCNSNRKDFDSWSPKTEIFIQRFDELFIKLIKDIDIYLL